MSQNLEEIEITNELFGNQTFDELFYDLDKWIEEQEDNNMMMQIADTYEINQNDIGFLPNFSPITSQTGYNIVIK